MRVFALLLALACMLPAQIKLGIVGTDTSHVSAFAKNLNGPNSPDHIPGAVIVAAYKGGSPDVESSYTRVDKFAEELRTKWNIEIVNTIPELCKKVDAVLLESVDGRVHLAQAKQIIAAKKPMFIDKPLASTLEDAREIARLAKEAGVPWFSSSSLRYGDIVTSMKRPDASAVITWGPGPFEPHHYLDLSWYGIHATEMLYALLGPGCEEVTRISTPDGDVITGRWKDGRTGTVKTLRDSYKYGAVVFRPKEVLQSSPDAKFTYTNLLKEIIKFFETKQPPVSNEETLELFAFMDAAQRSKEAGGRPMKLR